VTLAVLLAALLGQGYAPTRQGLDPLDAEREVRVMRLGKQLRCAVCQGVAISDSPASMARAQLDKVRELVAQGQTDEQVLAYFVERYGEWVLLEPTTGGLNLLLWTGPLLLLGVGLARNPPPSPLLTTRCWPRCGPIWRSDGRPSDQLDPRRVDGGGLRRPWRPLPALQQATFDCQTSHRRRR